MPMGCRVIRAATAMVLVGAMAVLAGGVAGAQQPVATGTLRGRVVDAVTGDVVPRARLRLTAYGMTAVADDLGVYVFTGVPVGATTLIASAPGYRDYTQNIQVFGGEQTLDVLLTPVGAPAGRPAPAPAPFAAPAAPPPRARSAWGLYASGGYATVAMKDFNSGVDRLNRGLGNSSGPGVQVDKFERIESGFFGEVGLRLGSGPVQLLLGGQYLKPRDSSGGASANLAGGVVCDDDFCYHIVSGEVGWSLTFAPSVLGATAKLALTFGGEGVRLGIVGGGGYYQGRLTARFKQSISGTVDVYDAWTLQLIRSETVQRSQESQETLTGSGFGFEGGVQLSLPISESSELRVGASYVSLKISDLKTDRGDELGVPMDLSGVRAFAGISLGF